MSYDRPTTQKHTDGRHTQNYPHQRAHAPAHTHGQQKDSGVRGGEGWTAVRSLTTVRECGTTKISVGSVAHLYHCPLPLVSSWPPTGGGDSGVVVWYTTADAREYHSRLAVAPLKLLLAISRPPRVTINACVLAIFACRRVRTTDGQVAFVRIRGFRLQDVASSCLSCDCERDRDGLTRFTRYS